MSLKAQPLRHSSLTLTYFGGTENLTSMESPDGDVQHVRAGRRGTCLEPEYLI